MCVCVCVCVCIYIYIERERERERESIFQGEVLMVLKFISDNRSPASNRHSRCSWLGVKYQATLLPLPVLRLCLDWASWSDSSLVRDMRRVWKCQRLTTFAHVEMIMCSWQGLNSITNHLLLCYMPLVEGIWEAKYRKADTLADDKAQRAIF